MIPLVDTTLLTNAPGEPRVGNQVLAEIESADAIDLVMAFIRRSGLRPLLGALKKHCDQGKPLRVLTTTYTGSTEPEALALLTELGAEVRVSYDLTTARLHAKAWLFHRHSALSTAYVGSSNLTHSAQIAGMEWNVRVSAARNPDVVSKIGAVFQNYWLSGDFVPYVEEQFRAALDLGRQRGDRHQTTLSPIEIRLEPFQERLLERIEVARQNGWHHNLLVSATGTGKTVMAAVDYARLRKRLGRARLLFIAHRREILQQSLSTFRHAIRDYTFGDLWLGGHRPEAYDHLFASVQTLASHGPERLAADHFDVVIIDEFHHAAAESYEKVLKHLRPKELLGLTATPERADGLPILHWFGDRIAAELRLWDAIEQHRLSPFVYYGIHDGIDLTDIPWRRGQGYDLNALTEAYVGNESWIRFVYDQLHKHVDNVHFIRCLGFCASVDHARYMAAEFHKLGITAVAVSGTSSDEERRAALRGLEDGTIQVVFSVDLFNEGVDVPAVDTLLFLRPTDSATLFLQQLGRGLRLMEGKTVCTVLDFVGLHRREFRFDRRYRALIGGSRRDLEKAVEDGFPFLPAGCHMELDRVAQGVVLRSIREAVPAHWKSRLRELKALAQARKSITLTDYLTETGLELSDIYANNSSWSDLREAAGLPVAEPGPSEALLRRALGRLQHIDDRQRLTAYRQLAGETRPEVGSGDGTRRRLLRMLVAAIGDQVLGKDNSLAEAVQLIWSHPQVMAELGELMHALRNAPDHVQQEALPGVPLQIHGRYTRIEILAAVGEGKWAKTPPWREGVYDAKGIGADLLAFTLDKTSGDFSPTTRYQDYAISRELIHWESQSTTAANSPTGQRYQNHVAMGRSILLFARPRVTDRSFWFLGPAEYVSHEGERPMAVTWRLKTPLSGDLYAQFAAAIA
ncbi:superfamily II DNA or RNA helicase [Actinoplanes teichomyceticus]|uniref:Superfamily II DNA or RNA helicase n=1 Tax=Actinoplanes teichomyceticus TaxID=1867 RepID=A0A561WQV2_ACTTI|nr:superfamily II DNA or RNA helicase [Actinoplanes teichomyceticus]